MVGGERSSHNDFSGSARAVVQAGAIHGDVHFHWPATKVPRQLPPRVDLVNQVRVLAELERDIADRPPLDDPVIKVVLGPRGSGKSTVATSWLHRVHEWFPDGQLYAALGAWSDHQVAPREVLGEFLVSLGVERGNLPADLASRASMFRSVTHGLSLAVFLDDVVSPAQVRSLLPGPGGSVVVVTGHGAFGVLARQRATLIDIDPLEPDMAVELLGQFADERLHADDGALRGVLELCAGLPVALCLVGGMLAERPTLSLAELLAELAEPDAGITVVAAGDEPTLGSLFDATYARLSPRAQAVYRALGAHPGTGDVSVAALAAGLGVDGPTVRRAVDELVSLRVVENPVAGRVVVHHLVRGHAARTGEVVDRDGRDAVRQRLLDWYVTGAVTAEAAVMGQRVWRRRLFPAVVPQPGHEAGADSRGWLERERANLRAVVVASYEDGAFDAVAVLCLVLWALFEPGKYYDDLLATNELGVRAAEHSAGDVVRAVLLTQMGFAHLHLGDTDAAVAACRSAVGIARAAGDVEAEATAVECAGLAWLARDQVDEARSELRRNLALAESVGDPRRIALARFHLAKAEAPEVAVTLLDRALAGFRGLAAPEPRNFAKIMTWQGRKLGESGRTAQARERLEQARAITAEQHWPFDQAQVFDALGDLETGDAAKAFYEQAIALYAEHGFVNALTRTAQRLAALS
ncbi:NB-ARC domain-containing protein [Saccharothrix sp. NRRL B-16314]|uniref:NB-ARC domain-containing protein n=1 Tax=Saccharothrix sp. NRRL B-16314 TaxID=1463825 RepID=UPI0005250864|nr:NB-ARC domain-containing protein [Saccharothrix sp. NRRL B-16314]